MLTLRPQLTDAMPEHIALASRDPRMQELKTLHHFSGHKKSRMNKRNTPVMYPSRVQATQRAGRAGRTQPGKCFRLYTRAFYEQDMAPASVPEIQRSSLTTAVLYLKSLPLDIDVLAFDFLDRPSVPPPHYTQLHPTPLNAVMTPTSVELYLKPQLENNASQPSMTFPTLCPIHPPDFKPPRLLPPPSHSLRAVLSLVQLCRGSPLVQKSFILVLTSATQHTVGGGGGLLLCWVLLSVESNLLSSVDVQR